MLKKFICLAAALCMIFGLSAFVLKPTDDFYIFGKDNKKICKILDITEKELTKTCKDNFITYFAINKNNTKQIKLTETKTSFSKKIGNLTHLSDETALSLTEEALIPQGVKGQIITKDAQKFVKTEVETNDSGGKFIITTYITVSDKKLYTLSFYTKASLDTSYTEEIFESFKEDGFYSEKATKSPIVYIIWTAIILLALGSAFIIYTIIKDIKNP